MKMKKIVRSLLRRKNQIAAGIVLLIISAIIFIMTLNGTNIIETDATPALLIAPLGIYLIFTKQTMF